MTFGREAVRPLTVFRNGISQPHLQLCDDMELKLPHMELNLPPVDVYRLSKQRTIEGRTPLSRSSVTLAMTEPRLKDFELGYLK